MQGARLQVVRTDLVLKERRERREQVEARCAELIAERHGGAELDLDDRALLDAELAVARAAANAVGAKLAISGWSGKSRVNLLRKLASLNMVGHWGMVTLTVPGMWPELVPDPTSLKAGRKALRRRWEREYGDQSWSAVWKLEFQDRGAPHFHIGVRLPDDIEHRDLRRWVSTAWHEVLCHPAGSKCAGPSCEYFDHLRYGTRLDAQYGDNLRRAGAAFASYFAKHGVWSSKEYQHRLPGRRWRGHAGILDLMAGAGAGDQLRELADRWDNPGRWWGIENVEHAQLVEGDMTPSEVEAARLVARKVVARRTWRYIEHDDSSRPVLVRRTIRSLHGEAGFWLLATHPAEFVHWFLTTVRAVAALPPGLERARFLARLEEPGSRPHPRRRALAEVTS